VRSFAGSIGPWVTQLIPESPSIVPLCVKINVLHLGDAWCFLKNDVYFLFYQKSPEFMLLVTMFEYLLRKGISNEFYMKLAWSLDSASFSLYDVGVKWLHEHAEDVKLEFLGDLYYLVVV